MNFRQIFEDINQGKSMRLLQWKETMIKLFSEDLEVLN